MSDKQIIDRLTNAFTVGAVPGITSVTPNTGRQGQTLPSVAVVGQFTNFLNVLLLHVSVLGYQLPESYRAAVVLAVTDRPKGDVEGGFWDFAQGYAHLREGRVDFANLYLARVKKAAEESKGMFRMHTARSLLGTVGGILEGEIQRNAGNLAGAIAAFERAVALDLRRDQQWESERTRRLLELDDPDHDLVLRQMAGKSQCR